MENTFLSIDMGQMVETKWRTNLDSSEHRPAVGSVFPGPGRERWYVDALEDNP